MTIGDRVRQARSEAKLTQKALAARVGLTQPTLSDLESNNSKGTASIAQIAAVLGVSALWLETGKGTKCIGEYENTTPADQEFVREISREIADRDIPEHIRSAISTLITSSPKKSKI